jgi:hypothetical protein
MGPAGPRQTAVCPCFCVANVGRIICRFRQTARPLLSRQFPTFVAFFVFDPTPMADKIFRSGAPHAVETNPVTRNAVLPRHELQATDPLQTERAVAPPSDGEAPLTHSNHSGQALAQPAAQYRGAKSHLSENRQGLDATSLQDNLQGVGGSEHIQEDIRYHEKKTGSTVGTNCPKSRRVVWLTSRVQARLLRKPTRMPLNGRRISSLRNPPRVRRLFRRTNR